MAKVVMATGAASMSGSAGTGAASGGKLNTIVEAAMKAAIENAHKEADAIWNDAAIPEDERRTRTAACVAPAEISRRMMAARAEAKRLIAEARTDAA